MSEVSDGLAGHMHFNSGKNWYRFVGGTRGTTLLGETQSITLELYRCLQKLVSNVVYFITFVVF